jgi:ATP-dependent protease HslVU (ClpYQ) peptidase subunit
MSTIVVVRKAGFACIACDTLATIGALKQKSHYSAAQTRSSASATLTSAR